MPSALDTADFGLLTGSYQIIKMIDKFYTTFIHLSIFTMIKLDLAGFFIQNSAAYQHYEALLPWLSEVNCSRQLEKENLWLFYK